MLHQYFCHFNFNFFFFKKNRSLKRKKKKKKACHPCKTGEGGGPPQRCYCHISSCSRFWMIGLNGKLKKLRELKVKFRNFESELQRWVTHIYIYDIIKSYSYDVNQKHLRTQLIWACLGNFGFSNNGF
jgi:hypothetical protein